jgi:hypothetical protein
LTVAIAAALVALVGQAGILFDDFGGANHSRSGSSARMITAAAVSKAGAIETWPKPLQGGESQVALASAPN